MPPTFTFAFTYYLFCHLETPIDVGVIGFRNHQFADWNVRSAMQRQTEQGNVSILWPRDKVNDTTLNMSRHLGGAPTSADPFLWKERRPKEQTFHCADAEAVAGTTATALVTMSCKESFEKHVCCPPLCELMKLPSATSFSLFLILNHVPSTRKSLRDVLMN